MFIGGLNWETTDRKIFHRCISTGSRLTQVSESLRDYFSQFGEVSECTVMRDNATGRSRGFGFLTFRDPKTVNTVMVKEHYLDGKIVRSYFEKKLYLTNCYRYNPLLNMNRLIRNVRFHEMNKKKPARSSWAVSAKKLRNRTLSTILHNLGV